MPGPRRTEYVIRAFDDDDGRVIPRPVSEQSHRAGINHSQTISFLSSPLQHQPSHQLLSLLNQTEAIQYENHPDTALRRPRLHRGK
jgi:hypothetical protein